MSLIIQGLIGLLVLVSLGLIVLVPTSLASPKDWENSKSFFALMGRIWAGLVLVVGFISVFGA